MADNVIPQLSSMPFVYSKLITPSDNFRRAFAEMCGESYERPQIAVIGKKPWNDRRFLAHGDDAEYIDSNGDVKVSDTHYIENLPSDKDIAKNRKLFDFWRQTCEQVRATLKNR